MAKVALWGTSTDWSDSKPVCKVYHLIVRDEGKDHLIDVYVYANGVIASKPHIAQTEGPAFDADLYFEEVKREK
jgi:hypothetical protein